MARTKKPAVKRTSPKKSVKKVVKEVSKETKEFQFTLRVGDQVYESDGDTVLEALEGLQMPNKVFIKSFLTLTSGEKRVERMYMPSKLKALLYPVARSYSAKKFVFLLK